MRIGTDLFLTFQRRMTRPGRAPQPVGGAEPFPLFDTADCLPSTRQQAQLGNSRVNLAERCSYGADQRRFKRQRLRLKGS